MSKKSMGLGSSKKSDSDELRLVLWTPEDGTEVPTPVSTETAAATESAPETEAPATEAEAESTTATAASKKEADEVIVVSPSVGATQQFDDEGHLIVKDESKLDFPIPAWNGQSELRQMGYYYTADGRCRAVEDDSAVSRFATQKKYEEFGASLERFLFHVLHTHYRMLEYRFHLPGVGVSATGYRVFASPNYHLKETVLFIIPGSGAVRASQWARSICINNTLADGTCFPFLQSAFHRGWGVVLCDPNAKPFAGSGRIRPAEHCKAMFQLTIHDKIVEAQTAAATTPSDESSTTAAAVVESSDGKLEEAADEAVAAASSGDASAIAPMDVDATDECADTEMKEAPVAADSSSLCGIKNVMIVAHSAGGFCTSQIIDKFGKFAIERDLIKGIAFTDCGTPGKRFSTAEHLEIYGKCARNYITSREPLGTLLSTRFAMPEFSAGNRQHEWTSASAYTEIFKFFDKNLGTDVSYVEPTLKGAEEESSSVRMRPGKSPVKAAEA